MLHGDRFDDFVEPIGVRVVDKVITILIVLNLSFVVHRGSAGYGKLVVIGFCI